MPQQDDGMDMPPMPPMGADPMGGGMDDPMGGDMGDSSLDNEGDEVSPLKSYEQLVGKVCSAFNNYKDTADPEEARTKAKWGGNMFLKAIVDVLDNNGKKSMIKTLKGMDDKDFNGLDDNVDMADDVEAEADMEADNAGNDAEMSADMQMGM